MSKEKLEVGNVVVYKLGKDMPMTISIIDHSQHQSYCCQFFGWGIFKSNWFAPEELEFVRD